MAVFNPPLLIGIEFYHTVDQLKRDFGNDLVKPSILDILPEYFAVGNAKQVEPDNKKHIAELTKFLNGRIAQLKEGHVLETNNSLKGNRKRTIIRELEDVIDNFGKVEDQTPSKTVAKKDILEQLFKSLWLIANMKDDPVKVTDDWEAIVESLNKITIDEQLQQMNGEKIPSKSSPNALKAYMSNSKKSTNGENAKEKCTPLKIKNRKTKINLLKLFTLFKTQESLKGIEGFPADTTDVGLATLDINNKLDPILEQLAGIEDTNITHNIRLSYRSITRFYRDRYLRTMVHLRSFIDRKEITLDKYPIDAMIRLVYIMNELERFVYKTGIDPKNNLFVNNEGLIKLKKTSDEYEKIKSLVKEYKAYTKTLPLTNEIDPTTNTNDLNYQLIQMHTVDGPYPKGILQLVNGTDINYDESVLNEKIADLSRISSKMDYTQLKESLLEFLGEKETHIYILYQHAPTNLLKTKGVKIKQLDDLECLIATVDSVKLEPETSMPIFKTADTPGIFAAISKSNRSNTSKIPNTCATFGITMKEKPYQLVQSITPMIGTLLNGSYIDYKTFFPKTPVDGPARA